VIVDENIPNLFFVIPQAQTPSSTPADSAVQGNNVHVRNNVPDATPIRAPQVEATRGATAGSRFVARYATPNEIVSRAAALDNVAGALIGLPDGLLVASRLGPDMNADTLAAFLPQIFGKVSQCTKELRMGELNNLTFTVGAIPWELFRVNAIFFAVFGHPGQPLPVSQLAGLAAELDHKPK
jgi:predicted regulator of Ras-like GTPase activity (Roadblock/LC7/MglB family)